MGAAKVVMLGEPKDFAMGVNGTQLEKAFTQQGFYIFRTNCLTYHVK